MRFAGFFFAALLSTSASAVSVDDGHLLSSLVSTEAARDPRIDVISAADLRKSVDLEAQRSLAGCDVSSSSCLAEVAAAMNAGAVLHGSIGSLGGDVILTLNLFDSNTARGVGRSSQKAGSVSSVGDLVDDAVREVLRDVPAAKDGQRVRVLVLDLDVVGATEDTASSFPMLSGVGLGVAGLGAVGLGIAVISELSVADIDNQLTKKLVDASEVDRLVTARGSAQTIGQFTWVAGGILVAGGAVLAVIPLIGGE